MIQLHLLTEFLTGHYRPRKNLIRMGLPKTDECRFCAEEEETSIHQATKCPAIENQRSHCFNSGVDVLEAASNVGKSGANCESFVSSHNRSRDLSEL